MTSSNQRYEIIERIDAGGMAEVFRGKSISMAGFERLVAIKRVLPHLVENKKFLQMFLDEAKLCLSLVHANIVQVFDLGHSGATYFIVMEYVEGTNLRTLLNVLATRNRFMDIAHACYIITEVCQGLTHAHRKCDLHGRHMGIVHRDVSPPNILLSNEGGVKLTDFGLAKANSQVELTDPGVVKGKFGYLSPEAAYGHEVDPLTDIFACGIILWEMLANRRLFYGDTDVKTIQLVRRTEVPLLSNINPAVPRELDDIIQKILSREKDQRYQTAKELGRDLSDFLFDAGLRVTDYDIANLVNDAKRYDRSTPKNDANEINDLVQAEIDRLITLEEDDNNQQSPLSGESDSSGEIVHDLDQEQAIDSGPAELTDTEESGQAALSDEDDSGGSLLSGSMEDPRTWADFTDLLSDDTDGYSFGEQVATNTPPPEVKPPVVQKDKSTVDVASSRQPNTTGGTEQRAEITEVPEIDEATEPEDSIRLSLPLGSKVLVFGVYGTILVLGIILFILLAWE